MSLAMSTVSSLPDVLHQIMNLNIEFRELIAEGSWAEASKVESERRTMLQALFERPMDPSVRDRVLETLNELLQSDKTLLSELDKARELCSQQIEQLRLGRKATSAYEETSLMVQGPRMMQ